MSKFNEDTGELITANEAARMLQAFLAKHQIDPIKNDTDITYGNLYGINKLKALVQEIDNYNNGSKPAGEITGVRIYKCIGEHEGKEVEKVLVILVIDADKDLYPIRFEANIDQFTPNAILEMGMACPPWCPK